MSSHYSEPVSPLLLENKRLMTFKRRIWRLHDKKQDSLPFRQVRLANRAVAFGMVTYCVFFVEWGTENHVFMPIRRWMDSKVKDFLRLSEADKEELRLRGKVPPPSTPSSS